jgi:glycosyltransferase involved in cell wall biosynthesis
VEVIVSDNASTDVTKALVEDFLQRGMKLRYVRNEVNVGGDENIRRCYAMASGKYTWVFGDDDVIAPGALTTILSLLSAGEYDLVFLASYPFPGDATDTLPKRRWWLDAYNVTSDPLRFVDLVDTHSDLMFITSMIINRERAQESVVADNSRYVANNIIQLSWILPVLKNMRRGLYVDAQLVGIATLNAAGGYDAGHYFGLRFKAALDCWLDTESALSKRLINNHLTMWVTPWLDWMWNIENMSRDKIDVVDPHQNLLPIFGSNPRYWTCVYPMIVLPELLAKTWAFPWLVRRKLMRLWYQTITPKLGIERRLSKSMHTETLEYSEVGAPTGKN